MLLSEEQTLIRDTARAFAREQVLPHVRAWETAGEIPRTLLAEMGRMGFMGMTVPADGVARAHRWCPTCWRWRRSPPPMADFPR
jgi:alkylation response protein AidB-like acyl-CoA dehydrogenase